LKSEKLIPKIQSHKNKIIFKLNIQINVPTDISNVKKCHEISDSSGQKRRHPYGKLPRLEGPYPSFSYAPILLLLRSAIHRLVLMGRAIRAVNLGHRQTEIFRVVKVDTILEAVRPLAIAPRRFAVLDRAWRAVRGHAVGRPEVGQLASAAGVQRLFMAVAVLNRQGSNVPVERWIETLITQHEISSRESELIAISMTIRIYCVLYESHS